MTAPDKERTEHLPRTAARPLGPHPGEEPRANPAARWLTVVIGTLLIALSGVIARELWMASQDEPFMSWLEPAYDFFASTAIDAVAVTVGIIASLVGLWLIITAFLPRRRTHVRVQSPVSIWVRPVDVARKATNVARAETGSATVRSKANRKKLTVTIDDDGQSTSADRVTQLLSGEFGRLQTPPAVDVRLAQPAAATSSSPAPATQGVN